MQKELHITWKSQNEIRYIPMTGGIIGLFSPADYIVINRHLKKMNQNGWKIVTIFSAGSPSYLLCLIVLIITFGLFTWRDGYFLVLEKSYEKSAQEEIETSLFE